MAGILLISEQKLKSFTSINKNVDIDLIKAEIQITQDIHLQQILGTGFLEHLYSKVGAGGSNTFTADEKILVDDYIAPFLIQKSYAEMIPSIWARTVNRGVVVGSTESSESVDLATMQYLRNIQNQRADFYRARLIEYLNCGGGVGKFPEYDSQTNLDGMTPDKHPQYLSPIHIRRSNISCQSCSGIESYSENDNMYKNFKKY